MFALARHVIDAVGIRTVGETVTVLIDTVSACGTGCLAGRRYATIGATGAFGLRSIANPVPTERRRPAVHLATTCKLATFANRVAATSRRRRRIKTHPRICAAARISTAHWIDAVSVPAAEASRSLARLKAIAIGRTGYTVFAVTGVAHSVTAQGTRARCTVGGAADAVFPKVTRAIGIAYSRDEGDEQAL